MPGLENVKRKNAGLENTGPENAGLENKGPHCKWWKMDQEEATLYHSRLLNTSACFNEIKTIIRAKMTQCNKV